ncbi:MAG TPA: hypothetical protein VF705_12705 [Longimicrobium sp.]|jgi:hypothetical protein
MPWNIRRQASVAGRLAGLVCLLSLAACEGTPVSSPGGPPAHNLSPDDEIGGGGGGTGGEGEPVPPFDPPPPPFFVADMPFPAPTGGFYACRQEVHVWFAGGPNLDSRDLVRGETVYFTGVVVPQSPIFFRVYNRFGTLVMEHNTQKSQNNCVVHHEVEGESTAGLNPGYYFVYASYLRIVEGGDPRTKQGVYVGPMRIR